MKINLTDKAAEALKGRVVEIAQLEDYLNNNGCEDCELLTYICHPSEKKKIWEETKVSGSGEDKWDYPGDDAFMAFFNYPDNEAYVFVDETAPVRRIRELVIHELVHYILFRKAPFLYHYFRERKGDFVKYLKMTMEEFNATPEIYAKYHGEIPEERFCIEVSTYFANNMR